MSTPRDLGDRVAEKEAQLKKALEKAELYKAQLKQLQAKKDTQDRKRRTHNLIIAGAELAALYGRVLYPEEVRQVIAFLRQQKDAGFFSPEEQNEVTETLDPEAEDESPAADAIRKFFDF